MAGCCPLAENILIYEGHKIDLNHVKIAEIKGFFFFKKNSFASALFMLQVLMSVNENEFQFIFTLSLTFDLVYYSGTMSPIHFR